MANKMFTRSISVFSIKAYRVGWENGKPVAEKTGEIQAEATYMNNTVARKLLKEAGFDCPRGTQIQFDEIDKKQYGMTVEEFMQYAHVIEE